MRAFLRSAFLAIALFGTIVTPLHGGMFLTQDIVDNGSIAYAANFPTLGAVWVQTNGVWTSAPASGTLAVRDNIVITAAHVLDGSDGYGGGITEVRFYLGGNVYSPSHAAFAVDWEQHPDYVPNGLLFGNNDLAVLKLDRSFADIDPTDLFTGTLTTGMSVSMGGFGLTGTNGTGYQPFDGSKRAGTNTIEGSGGDGSPIYSSFDSNFVFSRFSSLNATSFEWQGGRGDSGGGWFAADGSLVAVNSFVTGLQVPGAFSGASTGAINLENYRPWLNETITTMTVPEPSSFMLAGSAAVGLCVYRFRRLRQSTRSPKSAL